MLGTALRRTLAQRNLPVLQLIRRAPVSPDQLQWNPTATPSIANPEPLEGLTAAVHFSGADVAAHRWTSAYKRELIRSRVQSTRALATALANLRRPPQVFLAASATGFYGNRGDELLDETSARGSGFLADLCQEWEDAARPASDAGIRVVHLRFGVVLGAGRGALARLLPLFRLGLGGPLGSRQRPGQRLGQQWMSWISLADALAAVIFASEATSLTGPVNLTAPQPVTNAEFTRALAAALHRPAILPAPSFALRLALGEMADEVLLSSARAFPSRLTYAGFHFTYPTLDQALDAALALS